MRWMVRAAALTGALVVGPSVPGEAGPADARLAAARYVALGFNVGTGIVPETDVSPEVLREERLAAQQIRKAIQAWGKYLVVDRPARADLIVAIRKGRIGSVGGGGRTGGPATGPAGPAPLAPGPLAGAQFSSPDDLLEVLDPASAQPIWRATRANGLVGEVPPLFEALRAEVQKAEAALRKP